MKNNYIVLFMLALLCFSGCGKKTQNKEAMNRADVLQEKMTAYTGNIIQPLSEMRIYEYEADATTFSGFASCMLEGNGNWEPENFARIDRFVRQNRKNFQEAGYQLFFFEDNKNEPFLGAVESQDKFDVLRWRGTDGINYGVTNEKLVERLKIWDENNPLFIYGVAFDWVAFSFENNISNPEEFARELYEFCPDIIDQGFDDMSVLTDYLKNNRTIFLWWD